MDVSINVKVACTNYTSDFLACNSDFITSTSNYKGSLFTLPILNKALCCNCLSHSEFGLKQQLLFILFI